ncbi:MAG: hypothetical protein K2G45_12685 [Lachnospiraceae bacterium]|nr:hypothetical protein [Lachnospiraceae bacterium]
MKIDKEKDLNKINNKKGKKRIIAYFFAGLGAIILLVILVNIIKYESIKVDYKKTLEREIEISLTEDIDKVDLVGLLDSYGVPYSSSVDESFMDLLENELVQNNQFNSRIDLYNLYINKTWHLDGIFNNKVTINEMIDMKNFALDFVRYKYDTKIKTTLSYDYSEENGEKSVYDYVASLNNPVVLYSCSANDLFYYFGTSLESLNFERGIELLRNLDNGLDFLENNVQRNINTIIECNSKSQIFVMGIYVPSDSFFINRAGSVVIDKINDRLKRVCDRYDNVYYVDVSAVCFSVLEDDFHPDQNGQKIIAVKLADTISENLKPVTEYTYNTTEKEKVTQDEITCDEFIAQFRECELPMRDYIEYSVAIEWTFDELKCKNISFDCLNDIENDIVDRLCNSVDTKMFEQGYKIVMIEHKILDGMIESNFSLHPETKQNDKLSLIQYYDD